MSVNLIAFGAAVIAICSCCLFALLSRSAVVAGGEGEGEGLRPGGRGGNGGTGYGSTGGWGSSYYY